MGTKICVDCFCYKTKGVKHPCIAKKVTLESPLFVKETPGNCSQYIPKEKLTSKDDLLVETILSIQSSLEEDFYYHEKLGVFANFRGSIGIMYKKEVESIFPEYFKNFKPSTISKILLRQKIEKDGDITRVDNCVLSIIGGSLIDFSDLDGITNGFECKTMLATEKNSPIALVGFKSEDIWVVIAPCAFDDLNNCEDMLIPSYEVATFLNKVKEKNSDKKTTLVFDHFFKMKNKFVPQDTLDDLK